MRSLLNDIKSENLTKDINDVLLLSASYGKLFREYDSQPQVILAAAFYALRYMPATSLWSETYDEILSSSDSITEDYNQTKASITSWLIHLSSPKFELVSLLAMFY